MEGKFLMHFYQTLVYVILIALKKKNMFLVSDSTGCQCKML